MKPLLLLAAMAACGSDARPVTVIAAGGSDDPRDIEGLIETTRGQLVVSSRHTDARTARIWDGGSWERHAIYEHGRAATSGVLGQIDGRPALVASALIAPEEGLYPFLRSWAQGPDGAFAPAGNLPGVLYRRARRDIQHRRARGRERDRAFR